MKPSKSFDFFSSGILI